MTSYTGYNPGYGNKTPENSYITAQPTMSPEQMQYYYQQLGAMQPAMMDVYGQLGKAARGDESYYKQLEAPAFREFEGAMGQLGSRFAGMGTGGTRSSGFRLAAGGMAQDLAERLQSQRMTLRQQAIRDLVAMSSDLMHQQPYQYAVAREKPKPKWWQTALGIGLPIAGAVAGGAFGGPVGATMGAGIGSSMGEAFM